MQASIVFYEYFCADPIENDAANIKACIHVLRILIKNADTEISELEEDIILLQSQLALTDETWSESFSNVLREKIKFLEMSLKRMKNENVRLQGVDDQFQVHPEPAEKIHDILKRLLEKQSPRNDEQVVLYKILRFFATLCTFKFTGIGFLRMDRDFSKALQPLLSRSPGSLTLTLYWSCFNFSTLLNVSLLILLLLDSFSNLYLICYP